MPGADKSEVALLTKQLFFRHEERTLQTMAALLQQIENSALMESKDRTEQMRSTTEMMSRSGTDAPM